MEDFELVAVLNEAARVRGLLSTSKSTIKPFQRVNAYRYELIQAFALIEAAVAKGCKGRQNDIRISIGKLNMNGEQ